jgi:hypothetical protein
VFRYLRSYRSTAICDRRFQNGLADTVPATGLLTQLAITILRSVPTRVQQALDCLTSELIFLRWVRRQESGDININYQYSRRIVNKDVKRSTGQTGHIIRHTRQSGSLNDGQLCTMFP